jgi:hypothetical protein
MASSGVDATIQRLATCFDGQFVGGLLHLHRVLEGGLLLGGKRQRRPEPRILHGLVLVGIPGQLDLDHLVDDGLVAAFLLGARSHGRQQPLGVQVHALTGRADEPVARAPRVLGHDRAARRDVDRDRGLRPVVDSDVGGLVELTLERHPSPVQQPPDQLDRLAQAREPTLEVGPLDARDRHLVEDLAAARAERDATRVQRPEGAERVRHHRRVVAERRGQHAGAELDPLGPLAHRAQPRQRERRVPSPVPPRLEVVTDPDIVQAGLLREDAYSKSSRGANCSADAL